MTSPVDSEADLQIEHSLTFKRREWRVQRIGWAVMLLVVVAAAAGVFGVGPLSEASEHAPGSGSATYERFLRYSAPTSLSIEAETESFSDGTVRVWLSSAYLSGMQVEQVTPEPDSVEVSATGHTYTFRVSEPGPAQVEFQVAPDRIGWHSAAVRVGDGSPMTLGQFIYP